MSDAAPISGLRGAYAQVEGDPCLRPLPGVLCVQGTDELLVDVALRHLSRCEGWYRRASRIVCVGQDDHDKPSIIPVSASRFAARLSSVVRWQKINSEGETKEISCPGPIAAAAYTNGDWPALPALVSVSDVPVFRPDGSLWQTPGYDAITRTYYVPGIKLEPIPDNIDAALANDCLSEVVDVLCDMFFERDEMRYVPAAAIMGLISQQAAWPSPAFVFSASQPGTGKGTILQVINEIALGRAMVPFHFPLARPDDKRESDREEEQEKRLAQAAASGTRVLNLDNIPNGSWFGGPIFDRVVVAEDSVQLRQLGRNDGMIEFPWRCTFLVSGNHIHVLNDSRRRCFECVLVATCANPSMRPLSGFKYPDLRFGYCLKNRARLLWCCFVVLAHHAQKGGKATHERPDLANFERFQRFVCDAIVRAGGMDPSSCILTSEDTLTGDDQLVGCAMRALEKLGAHATGQFPEGVTATMFAEYVWSKEWADALKDNRPCLQDSAIAEAREVFTLNWRLHPSKRPAAKSISSRLGDLCGRVLHGAQIWPVDDASGFQASEWRIAQHVDRKNQPRYTVVPPRKK